MRRFASTACFDWSGAAGERHHGIKLAVMDESAPPRLIRPGHRWSRTDALDWLKEQANSRADMLIGMDVSMGFPFVDCGAFFPGWSGSPPTARALWRRVDDMSGDELHMGAAPFLTRTEVAAHFRHRGALGEHYGPDKSGRLRVVELESRRQALANPYSCLNLVGAAQVGKASLTAMRLLHRLKGKIAIWPFDPVPDEGPLLIEIYSAIAAVHAGLPKGRTKLRTVGALDDALAQLGARATGLPAGPIDDHASDAILTTAWLRGAQTEAAFWAPAMLTPEIAQTEGWTFGVA